MTASDTSSTHVIDFWRQAGPERWFRKDAAFDAQFRERLASLHFAAARRELDDWADTPEGALALLLLLDQYPRNSFRGTAHMYATDPLARYFALQMQARGFDEAVEPLLRPFCYLPLVHSESLADQDRAVSLTERLGGDAARHARGHRDIVARFGRFPHRNAVLGRATSAPEQAFLDQGGFSG